MVGNIVDNKLDNNVLAEKSLYEETAGNFENTIKSVRKQNDNRGDIYILQRTINNYGVYTGDDAVINGISINNIHNKNECRGYKNILNDKRKFCSWLCNADKYSIALLISCAVFYNLDYDNVRSASRKLYSCIEGDEKVSAMLGVTDFFVKFGIEICKGSCITYSGNVDMNIVRFVKKEAPKKIINYIWIECPDWRDIIINWLKLYIMRKPIVMSEKAIEAINYVATEDYFYFQNKILNSVSIDDNLITDVAIAHVFTHLIQNTKYKSNIYILLSAWSKNGGVHKLLILFYFFGMNKVLGHDEQILKVAIDRYINEVLRELRECKVGEWTKYIYDFYAAGMRSYTYYRILIDSLYQAAQNYQIIKSKKNVFELFLLLYGIDIDLTNYEGQEEAIMIKLCNSKQEVSRQLCFLWQSVWTCDSQRKIFYELMKDYVSKYNSPNHIKIFIERAFTDICSVQIKKDIFNRIYKRQN